MIKMPQPLKEEWIKALRSGLYTQHFNYMHSDTNPCAHCVIGVLDVLTDFELSKGIFNFNPWLKKYGIEVDFDLSLNYNGRTTHLTSLNDTIRLNFNELADLIEQQVEGY